MSILVAAALFLLMLIILVVALGFLSLSRRRSGHSAVAGNPKHSGKQQCADPGQSIGNSLAQRAGEDQRKRAAWARNPANRMNLNSPLNPADPLNPNNPANPRSIFNQNNPANPIIRAIDAGLRDECRT